MMLDRILSVVESVQSLDIVCGVFLSCFDANNILVASHGSLQTTKQLKDVIALLYTSMDTSTIAHVVVDVVRDITEHTDKQSLLALDLALVGICAVADGTSGVVLPGTSGVTNATQALALIKKKYTLTGKVRIYSFTTQRVVV